jgi:hypothetical protein
MNVISAPEAGGDNGVELTVLESPQMTEKPKTQQRVSYVSAVSTILSKVTLYLWLLVALFPIPLKASGARCETSWPSLSTTKMSEDKQGKK